MILIIIIILIIIYLIYTKICTNYFSNIKNPFKIDIVYTWAGENNDQNDIREAYNNELKYSLRSVFKNVSWVNHIYIVINTPIEDNIPSWFNDKYNDKITLVDQKEIFPKEKHDLLPCKVADIIETYIHLIPGLSEHFIFLNDDFFINKPLKFDNFFNFNKKIIINKDNLNFINMNKNKYDNRNYPFILKYKLYHQHVPYNMTISSRKEFINKYIEWIQFIRNQSYEKRTDMDSCSKHDLNSNCFQIHGPYFIYMYLNNKAIIDINYNQKYITGDVLNIYKLRFQFFNNSNFFVLNNIKSEYKTEIQKLLEQKFNNKLYFEK